MSGVIDNLLTRVDTITQQFVFDGYHNLVSAYSSAIYGLVALSVIVFGYLVVQGYLDISIREMSKRALIIGFVIAFAMHWDTFSYYIYNFFTQAPNQIALHIVESIPSNSHISVNDEIEKAFDDGMDDATAVWEHGGKFNWMPYMWAIMIFLVTLLFVVVALIELIVCKFGLAIYLVLAPLIIPLFLFQQTKGFVFDGWLRHLIVFAFIPIFITSALSLGMLLMADEASHIQSVINADAITLTDIAPFLICVLICTGLLFKATHMASSLAGGLANSMAGSAKNYLSKKLSRRSNNKNFSNQSTDTKDENE